MTTRPPLSLLGGPSRGFSPLRRPRVPPPPTSLRGDRGPIRRPRASQSLSHSQPRRPPFSLPCCFCAPWRIRVSPPSAVLEVTFPPPLPPSLPPTRIPPAPLSCVPPGDAVSRAGYSSTSPDSTFDVASLLPLSLFHPLLLSIPTPPLPTSLVALRPLALADAPLPPAPAANIAPRDEDVGYQTGGVVARRSLAGGSSPLGKWPRRPSVFVGDGKSRPRFLHLPQQ